MTDLDAIRARHPDCDRTACLAPLIQGCEVTVLTAALDAERATTAALREAARRFLRRTGGLIVRSGEGREYVAVPVDWVHDLDAALRADWEAGRAALAADGAAGETER